MKKMPSLFKRDFHDGPKGHNPVINEVEVGAEWVIAGEGVATRKWDGTCCMFRDGHMFKRYDAKHGKTPPEGFEPAQEPDPITGHWPGWIKVGNEPDSRWHMEARSTVVCKDGTYELCGPKINGNREGFNTHVLISHGKHIMDAPRTFDELKAWFADKDIEGIVWHHPDGRMVKIKSGDFGHKRRGSI